MHFLYKSTTNNYKLLTLAIILAFERNLLADINGKRSSNR